MRVEGREPIVGRIVWTCTRGVTRGVHDRQIIESFHKEIGGALVIVTAEGDQQELVTYLLSPFDVCRLSENPEIIVREPQCGIQRALDRFKVVLNFLKQDLSERADTWWRATDGRDVDYYESDYFRGNRHNSINT